MSEEHFLKATGNTTDVLVYPNKWISCAERLPEVNQQVLIYTEENEIYVAWIYKLHIRKGNRWQYSRCCGCFVPYPVIAWMPLPNPPEKEQKKLDLPIGKNGDIYGPNGEGEYCWQSPEKE